MAEISDFQIRRSRNGVSVKCTQCWIATSGSERRPRFFSAHFEEVAAWMDTHVHTAFTSRESAREERRSLYEQKTGRKHIDRSVLRRDEADWADEFARQEDRRRLDLIESLVAEFITEHDICFICQAPTGCTKWKADESDQLVVMMCCGTCEPTSEQWSRHGWVFSGVIVPSPMEA